MFDSMLKKAAEASAQKSKTNKRRDGRRFFCLMWTLGDYDNGTVTIHAKGLATADAVDAGKKPPESPGEWKSALGNVNTRTYYLNHCLSSMGLGSAKYADNQITIEVHKSVYEQARFSSREILNK